MMRKPSARRSVGHQCALCREVDRSAGNPGRSSHSSAPGRRPGQTRQSDRGLLSEHGIVIARDISQPRRSLAVIVGNDDDGLSDMVRSLMRELRAEMAELDDRIAS